MTATTSRNATALSEVKPLLEMIAADPTDTATRGVLADYLADHGYTMADLLTRELKRAARAECGERRTSNIDVTPDMDDATDEAGIWGRSWYYTTTTGVEVRHPNAYKRVAKSAELIYVPSSRVVVVGPKWLLARI